MRSITGWRFLLVIALPIFLASMGVVSMTFDLLDRVSGNADAAEFKRNSDLVTQAMHTAEADLGRLTGDNAQWEDAYANVSPQVNAAWFDSTWGRFSQTGTPYDMVAVLDEGSLRPAAIAARAGTAWSDASVYLGSAFFAMSEQTPGATGGQSVVTSPVNTPDGPAIAALAPIVKPSDGAASGKQLLMLRFVSTEMLAGIAQERLIEGLSVAETGTTDARVVRLQDAAGSPAFALTWQDRNVGQSVTGWARQKASAVLGFMILVMTGIAVVCWRLINTLVVSEEQARHAALHDALTELPNRAALIQRIRAIRDDKQRHFAIAFADLDGFKEVNDSYGHDIGDRLICAIGAGIAKLADQAELCCRMGGDEFVVLFKGEKAEAYARQFAQRLIGFLVQSFDIEGRILSVGASVGIAATAGEALDELEMLRRADIAMYKAKSDGKNRACVYDVSFDAERAENLAIAHELKGIIARGELGINFQPVVEARTGRVSGVEALARWPQSSSRKVSPDRFIRVAETSGLIDELGEAILDKACAAAVAWPELRLAVNISAVQLDNPRFVERSLAVIARHGLRQSRVEFEITESSLIRDADKAKAVFKALQRAGIKVALDDFGTGFSSIGYLRTFQFDRIKIDKSIVSKVLSSPAELAIVQGTLLVARGLSAEVTAEGVESEDEVAVLRLAGCTEIQGFHFHKPMPAAAVTEIVERARRTVPRQGAA